MSFLMVCLILILLAAAMMIYMKRARTATGIIDRWWLSEGFETATINQVEQLQRAKAKAKAAEASQEEDAFIQGASPVDLFNRQPYLLLDDRPAVLADDRQKLEMAPTARACYEADFSNQLSLLGSYRQMTNNYRHSYPDNCSALNKDLSMNFYSS